MNNTQSALELELAKLRAENTALKVKTASSLTLKVSEKGALSVYGLGRFPITLYKSQWIKLLAATEKLNTFIANANGSLKEKE